MQPTTFAHRLQTLLLSGLAAFYCLLATPAIGSDLSSLEPPPLNWDDAPTIGKESSAKPVEIDCTVQLKQHGHALVPTLTTQGIQHYLLGYGTLRVEVPDLRCRPSVSRPRSMTELRLLASLMEVASLPGYELADVLKDTRSLAEVAERGVAISLEHLSLHRNAVDEHRTRCIEEARCPQLIGAYRSYWPFMSTADQSDRSFADFVVTQQESTAVKGKDKVSSLVVYTHSRHDLKSGAGVTYLKPTVMLLHFRDAH